MKVYGEQVDETVIDVSLSEAFASSGATNQGDLAAILRRRGVRFDLEAACRIFAREKRRGTVVWVERERMWRKA